SQVNDPARANNTASLSTPFVVTLSPAPDLRPTTLTPGTAVAGQPLTVAWSITNSGSAAGTSEWFDTFGLSATPALDGSAMAIVSQPRTGGLAAGATLTGTVTLAVPPTAPPNLYVVLATDARNDVYEYNAEANNLVAVPVTVALPAPSDIVVQSVT